MVIARPFPPTALDLGYRLPDRLRAYESQEACLIIILIIVAVYAIDYLSKIPRERFIHEDPEAASKRFAKMTTGED